MVVIFNLQYDKFIVYVMYGRINGTYGIKCMLYGTKTSHIWYNNHDI